MIESLIKEWEGETLITHYDRLTGARILIAIHSTRLGAAAGGTRMKSYPDLQAAVQDAFRLSAAMTYKFAVHGMRAGGGKAVIALPADFDPQARAALLRRYGALVHQLGGLFFAGPDVGTSDADMAIIAETAGVYVFVPTREESDSSGHFTAQGLFTSLKVVCEHLFADAAPSSVGMTLLAGRRVLVQGAGNVGERLIKMLHAAGAEVLFSEVDESIIRHLRDQLGLEFVPPEEIYATECDIFAPCALGGILNAYTIAQLKCRAIVGGANNQLAEREDAERLWRRGILYTPDYLINAGGALGLIGMEQFAWTAEQAEREVIGSIRHTLKQVLNLAEAEGISTEAAARRIAEEHLSTAK
jgi:glutamate dehydrogenase/leucine dehydrogenase